MKLKVIAQFDNKVILGRCGIGNNGLRKYLASRVKMRSDPYVPKQSGILKDMALIATDGSMIIYNQPYAHYQYHGEVMGPNFLTKNGWRSRPKSKGGKYYTGREIHYNGGPMRGPNWDKRMMAEHREDVEKDVAAYINSRKGG